MDHLDSHDFEFTRPATQVEIDQCDHDVQAKIAAGWMLRVEMTDDAEPRMYLVKDHG